MNIYAVASLSASLIICFLGVFVYFHNTKNSINRMFLISSSVIALWIFGCFMESTVLDQKIVIYVDKLLNFFAVLSPTLFVHTIYTIIGEKNKKEIRTAYLISIGLLIAIFTPFFTQGVAYRYSVRYLGVPGPLYFVFIFLLCWCGYYSSTRTYRLYLMASGYKRNQLLYLLLAILVIVIAAIFYFMLIFNIKVPPIDNYLNVVYGLIMTYAIVRHRLMDIEIVIKKSFVFAGLFTGIVAIYSVPLFIFQNLFQQTLGISQGLAAAFTVLAMMFGYERLKNFLIEITDKYLFQKKYEYRKALSELGKEATRLMKLETFTKILNRNVVRVIKLAGASVVVLDKKKNQYVFLAAARTHKENLGKAFSRDNILIPELQKADYLIAEDLERNLKSGLLGRLEEENIEKIHAVFKEYKSVLCVPSRFEKEIVGFMFFGEKLSQDPYSEEDLDLFVTISRQVALAINNSYLYEESLEKERELAKKEIEKQTEKIKRLASLGELAAGVAHEIRNPMTVLRSRAEDLKNEIDNEQYLLEFADLSVKHIDRILGIVNNMLRFAKEKEKNIFSEVDIQEVINDTLTLVAGRLKNKGIEVVKNLNSQKKIIGDANMLQQAILNIVMNSYDFLNAGGVLTVNSKDQENRVEVEIIDTGSGIPKDKLEHIFDPFFTTRAEGTGLGLSITYRIIQDHGGRINVESEMGRGTKFTIIFPSGS